MEYIVYGLTEPIDEEIVGHLRVSSPYPFTQISIMPHPLLVGQGNVPAYIELPGLQVKFSTEQWFREATRQIILQKISEELYWLYNPPLRFVVYSGALVYVCGRRYYKANVAEKSRVS